MTAQGLFQHTFGDVLDRSVSGNASNDEIDLLLERIAVALQRRPIKLFAPMVIESHCGRDAAIVIRVADGAKAQGVRVVKQNGEQLTLGPGLESAGICASYLHQREPYRISNDVAAQKGRRVRTLEDDPGTGYGYAGFGSGKPEDDAGNDSARPGELYENDFNNQYLRQNTGVFMAEGVLTTDLAAATNGKTGATTATMTVWVRDETSTADPIALKDGDSITVVNRDTTLSATAGRYFQVLKLNSEWRPFWVACAG